MSEGTWNELKSDHIFESMLDKIKMEENERKISKTISSNLKESDNDNYAQDKNGKLIEEEKKEEGKVSWKVYLELVRLMGVPYIILSLFCLISGQSLIFVSQWWVSSWANVQSDKQFQDKYSIFPYYNIFSKKIIYI